LSLSKIVEAKTREPWFIKRSQISSRIEKQIGRTIFLLSVMVGGALGKPKKTNMKGKKIE